MANPLYEAAGIAAPRLMRAAPQAAAPEDRASLARKIVGGVLSPVAAIGNVLDLPGSSVRDLFTGNNPLDQYTTAWWKDAGNRATGREVNTALFGAAPNDPTKWEWGDLGGFATEVALDPLSYVSGGMSALAKGSGGVARAAGLANKLSRVERSTGTLRSLMAGYTKKFGPELGKAMESQVAHTAKVRGQDLAKIIDQPVGHLMRVGVPFTNIGFGVNNKYLAGALDKLGKQVAESPVGRMMGTGFDYAAKGAYKLKDQLFNRGLTATLEEANPMHFKIGTEHQQKVHGARQDFLKDAAPHFDPKSANPHLAGKDPNEVFDSLFQHAMETHGKYLKFEDAFKNAAAEVGYKPSPAMTKHMVDTMREVRGNEAGLYGGIVAKGHKGALNQATDEFSYFQREINPDYAEKAGYKVTGETMLGTKSTHQREKVYEKIPTQILERIRSGKPGAADYYIDKTHGAARIHQDFGKYLGFEFKKKVAIPDPNDPSGVVEASHTFTVPKTKHSKLLQKELSKVDPSIPMFKKVPVEDSVFKYQMTLGRVTETLSHIHRFVNDHIGSGKHISIREAYKKVGMRPKQALEDLGKLRGVTTNSGLKKLGDEKISLEAFEAMVAHKKPVREASDAYKTASKFVDKLTQTYKTNWTMPSVPFHVRNLSGGTINELVFGPHENPLDALQFLWRKGKEMLSGGRFEPKHQGAMLDMRAHGVLSDEQKAFQDVAMNTMDPLRGNPLNVKQAWQAGGEQAKEAPWTLLGQNQKYIGKPVALANQAHKALLHTGEKAAGMIEYYNRAGMYKHLVENKGFSPQQAAREVEKLQFLYDKATPFEKEYMKRLFPFYGFISNQTKLTARKLAESPGGAGAQLIRAQNRSHDPEEVVPPHMADTMAIPLGTSPEGTKSYLTGFGNPIEAAAPFLAAPMLQSGALLDAAAASTPLIKWPAELATGQTFFQKGAGGGGRPLRDLDPAVGRLINNIIGSKGPADEWLGDPGMTRHIEHIIANTPLSKYVGMLKNVTDRRDTPAYERALNFTLPTQLQHITAQQQERLLQAASNEMADYLGAKSWSNRYFNAEQIARAEQRDPQKAETMKAMNALWAEAKKNAKKYRDQKGGKTKTGRTSKQPVRPPQVNELLRAAGL